MLDQLVNFCQICFLLTFFLFLNFCSKCGISFLHVYFFPFFCLLGLQGLGPKGGALSQTVPGCVMHHAYCASVTHFQPILGNLVEVTLVTSPTMYIFSHTKGTYFPLARITIMTPL